MDYTLKDNKRMFLSATFVLFVSFVAMTLMTQNAYAADLSWDSILNYFKQFANSSGASSTNIITIFGNLDGTFRVGIALTVMVARIIALYLAWTAIVKMVRVGDSRETQGGMWMTLLAAGLMFSVVNMLDLLSNTLGMGKSTEGIGINGTSMPKDCVAIPGTGCGADDSSLWEKSSKALIAIVSLFRLAGVLAVVRGILALHEIGHGKGQATYGKVCISMVAGAILYNIVPFAIMVVRQIAPGAEGFFLDSGAKGNVFIPHMSP